VSSNPAVEVLKTEVLSDNWYVLRKVTFRLRKRDGSWETQAREAYDRGNGATILPYNLARRTVILTRQFRLPTFVNGNESGMLIETCAGLLDEENPSECITRELREETGFSDVELGPEVWHRRHVVSWRGVEYDVRERWFIARVQPFDIDTSGFTSAERVEVLEHRWWTPEELAAATERLVPADLAARLRQLLAAGPPAEPVAVGI